MTRKPNTRRAAAKRRRRSPAKGLMYLIASLILAGLFYAAWFWWDMREWRPSEDQYPDQGAVIPSASNGVNFRSLKAIGAKFAYLDLQPASRSFDDDFASRFAAANEAAIDIGIVLHFDPCLRADVQSQRFTTMVPRDGDLLPPAIAVGATGDQCAEPVSDAAVESELLTLINQIEMHAGKPAIIKLAQPFEQRHRVASMLARDLWLERDRARPDYAGRPWLLWSANRQLVSDASEDPIEWVVVQK